MIKITDKYWIEVDDRQYIVSQKTITKSGSNAGKENHINHTYHATMVEALNNIIRRIQKDRLNVDEIMTLKQAIDTLVEVQKDFNDIVGGLEKYE